MCADILPVNRWLCALNVVRIVCKRDMVHMYVYVLHPLNPDQFLFACEPSEPKSVPLIRLDGLMRIEFARARTREKKNKSI